MPPPAEQLAPRLLAGPALRTQPDRRLVLPVLESLLAGAGPGALETATGAAGVAGAGLTLKASAVTVLVAGAVGAGVALHEGSKAPGSSESSSPSSPSLSSAGQG